MAKYKNVLVVDGNWHLTSAVRDFEPDTSRAYERLESRLRIHRAALRQCLINKPSTRYQLDLLQLVAFLSTLLVAMKRRLKVPDIARTLHNMTGAPRVTFSPRMLYSLLNTADHNSIQHHHIPPLPPRKYLPGTMAN